MHRDDRYGEKLATPDTSIADLIGEVDPIKVAEGRYLSDELTLHYGLVPRTNRGIFAINELPDLAERIQVGLLNVLEERDVQIRGYKVRLPLDVMLFASANPEDYTNRGRLITPLKDRFGAQIRTHYPLDVETEMAIVAQEARPLERRRRRRARPRVHGRDRRDALATWPARARTSTSAPACRCASRSPTTRRWSPTRPGGRCASARTTSCRACRDLEALAASTVGQGRDRVARRRPRRRGRRAAPQGGGAHRVQGALRRWTSCVAVVDGVRRGRDRARRRGRRRRRLRPRCSTRSRRCAAPSSSSSPRATRAPPRSASAVEFVLEGLHLSKRLNKDAAGSRATYRSR